MSDVADIGSDTTPQFVTESGELQKKAKKKKTNTRKEGNPTERRKQEKKKMEKGGKRGGSSHGTSLMPKTVLEWNRTVLDGRSLVARSPVCRSVPIFTTAHQPLRIASRMKW